MQAETGEEIEDLIVRRLELCAVFEEVTTARELLQQRLKLNRIWCVLC
jgi:hypothetical protein